MGDHQCLSHFQFRRRDLLVVEETVTSGRSNYSTKRNSYCTNRHLSTCVFLKQMSTPMNLSDMEELFRKQTPHLSEIFWETCDKFVDQHQDLITGVVGWNKISSRAPYLASKIQKKLNALDNCVRFNRRHSN